MEVRWTWSTWIFRRHLIKYHIINQSINQSDLTSVSSSQDDVRDVPSIIHNYKVLTHAPCKRVQSREGSVRCQAIHQKVSPAWKGEPTEETDEFSALCKMKREMWKSAMNMAMSSTPLELRRRRIVVPIQTGSRERLAAVNRMSASFLMGYLYKLFGEIRSER